MKPFLALSVFFFISLISCSKSSQPTLQAKLSNETPHEITYSPDGKSIAAGVWGAVRIWDLATRQATDYPTKLKNETPRRVSFSPDGRWIAAGTFRGVRVWNVQTKSYRDYDLPLGSVTPRRVHFSPDSRTLAAAAWGGVMTWTLGDSTKTNE
ncbi:WD40 repeat domain-containing protein [Siphonobacter sp.]|uniref:WD40 repeat domain-containing protein n=1 Tax=Siphonobacter sp. TaxID=1869184 RepID=UPI003B3B3FC9